MSSSGSKLSPTVVSAAVTEELAGRSLVELEAGKVPEANIPDRLSPNELSASIAEQAIARDGADPGEGGFWKDITPAADIARIRDRIFVGDAAALPGVYDAAEGSAGEYFPFSRWIARESSAVVASNIGRISVAGLSRASLSPASPAADPETAHTVSIGVAGFSYADVIQGTDPEGRNVNGWGGYFEGVKADGGQATFGVEIDVGNLGGTNATNTPYSMFGLGTFGLVVASGGSTGLPYEDATFGIAVTNNGAKFKSGLIFQANAIAGTDGVTGTGLAIEMAKGHIIRWTTPESGGSTGGSVYSSVAATANRVSLDLTDNAFMFRRAGAPIMSIAHGGGASPSGNFHHFLSSATGSALIHIAGSDLNTDVDLVTRPKGAGKGALSGGTTGAERFTWNDTGVGFYGYTPISQRAATPNATDLATAITLVNALKADLVAYGLKAS